MDHVELPSGVDELEEWLDRSGGRTGRIFGVRRARWEDWSVVHALATGPHAPFFEGPSHLSRTGDGQFELRRGPKDEVEGALFASMLFFEEGHAAMDVADAFFGAAEYALYWRDAIGKRRWLAVDMALEEADIDFEECRAALSCDPRLAELQWFEFVAILSLGSAPLIIDFGAVRPNSRLL